MIMWNRGAWFPCNSATLLLSAVPKRPPPTPPVLTTLSVLAALAACWIAVAVDQAARGAAGTLVGVAWSGLALTPLYLVRVVQGATRALDAWPLTLVVLAGPVAILGVGLAAHYALELFRTPGWARALALELALLALLWLPTALFAAASPGGGGPVAELYRRLGDPQAGRWTAAGLALLTLWVVGRLAAARAIAVGRSWMRVDGLAFRRRLVRVVAGYPALAALAALVYTAAWSPPGWTALWLALVLGMLVLRTP